MQYHFAQCVFDVASHRLTRDGAVQKLEPQVFDLLELVVSRAGDLVSWDDIVAQIWQGRAISDSTISARVAALRKALGDDGTRQAILRTVPRRGLMLVADVEADGGESAEPASTDNGPTSQVIRFTMADDGHNLAFAQSGEGPPLLRTAHTPTHLESDWDDGLDGLLFEDLGQYRRLVRYDVRGTGLSDTKIDKLTLDICIEDLRTVADAAGLDRFDLMGSSGSGVMTAIGFAARYPDRVRKLVLQSGCAEGRTARLGADDQSTETIEGLIREGWAQPNSPFIAAYLTTYFPSGSQAWISEITRKIQKYCPPESAILHRRAMNNMSVLDLLDRIKAPTLVIQSSDDAVHPVGEGRKLAAGIPGAQFRVFDSPNHFVLPSDAAWPEFLATLRAFLTDGEADAGGIVEKPV